MEATSMCRREPWNEGKLVGQKSPIRLREIWAIRVRLQLEGRVRDLALFNLGIDSKLRACDLVQFRVRDVSNGEHVAARAKVMQQTRWTATPLRIARCANCLLRAAVGNTHDCDRPSISTT